MMSLGIINSHLHFFFILVEETGVREFVDREQNCEEEMRGDKLNEEDDFFTASEESYWPQVDIIHECMDENGNIYFYNESTKQSDWMAPEWVEETDEKSGAR